MGRTASLILLLWLVVWPTRAAAALQPPQGVARQSSDWNHLVAEVAGETPSGSRVYFLTWDAAFMMNLTHRLSVSRYEVVDSLVVRGFASDARLAEYLDDLQANSPNVILISNFLHSPPADVGTLVHVALTWFANVNPAGENVEYPNRREFEDYIASHYQLETCIDVDAMCLLRRAR